MAENQPVTQTASPTSAPGTQMSYASFGKRLVAIIIDTVIIGIVQFVIQIAMGIALGLSGGLGGGINSPNEIAPAFYGVALLGGGLQLLLGYGYLVYFIGSRGQTLGKMAMNIKVVKIDTKQHPDFVSAFLREVIGKLLSAIFLLLGYLWMLWDDKKQTWHDKISKTVVINV